MARKIKESSTIEPDYEEDVRDHIQSLSENRRLDMAVSFGLLHSSERDENKGLFGKSRHRYAHAFNYLSEFRNEDLSGLSSKLEKVECLIRDLCKETFSASPERIFNKVSPHNGSPHRGNNLLDSTDKMTTEDVHQYLFEKNAIVDNTQDTDSIDDPDGIPSLESLKNEISERGYDINKAISKPPSKIREKEFDNKSGVSSYTNSSDKISIRDVSFNRMLSVEEQTESEISVRCKDVINNNSRSDKLLELKFGFLANGRTQYTDSKKLDKELKTAKEIKLSVTTNFYQTDDLIINCLFFVNGIYGNRSIGDSIKISAINVDELSRELFNADMERYALLNADSEGLEISEEKLSSMYESYECRIDNIYTKINQLSINEVDLLSDVDPYPTETPEESLEKFEKYCSVHERICEILEPEGEYDGEL